MWGFKYIFPIINLSSVPFGVKNVGIYEIDILSSNE